MAYLYDRWKPPGLAHTGFTDETHPILVNAEFARVLELCVIACARARRKGQPPCKIFNKEPGRQQRLVLRKRN